MLSVVTSVYLTAQFLEEFAARTEAAALSCGYADYEMIFVVDGSPDDALETLRRMKTRNPRIRVTELSRNFGHHPALWCGLQQASGSVIFLADADLETAPEILIQLHAAVEAGADAAFAYQQRRTESALRRWTYA
jgi:putative glycosyltransferase